MVMDIADGQAAKDRELIFGKRQFFEQLFEQLFDHYFGKETIIRTTLQPISEYYCLRVERVVLVENPNKACKGMVVYCLKYKVHNYVLVHSQSYISPRKPKYPKTFY